MSNVRIPIYGKEMIDNVLPGSARYSTTKQCEEIRRNFENYFYELHPGTPRINCDPIDGGFPGSMGYSRSAGCDDIRNSIAGFKRAYGWE